jgi:hypothetical protein
MRRLRNCELGQAFEEQGRSEDCSASCVTETTDLIVCTESPKCGLTESADRSIAREGQSSRYVSHEATATSALDKTCPLIEVRRSKRPLDRCSEHPIAAWRDPLGVRTRRSRSIRCIIVYPVVATRNGVTTREFLRQRIGDWSELCIASGSFRESMGPRPEFLRAGPPVGGQPDVT